MPSSRLTWPVATAIQRGMTLDAIAGQPRAIESLRAALRSGTVHHAYLFAGPEGVGKELTATALAQALLCPEKPREGCGECNVCSRIERRAHPDVTWILPDEERIERGLAARSDFTGSPSRDIRVEQVRQLQERLSLRPLEGNVKLAILSPAEAMNAIAQNALLKTLEEPPSHTHLILITPMPDVLLPTIRSRCSLVRFAPLPVEWVAQQLRKTRKIDEATARWVAELSGGSMARAMTLDVKTLARRTEIVERFEALTRDDVRPALRLAEELGDSRETAEDALRILSWWLLNVAAAKAGSVPTVSDELAARLETSAATRSEAQLHGTRDLIAQAQEALVGNASARLQLERVLLRSLGALT